MFNSSSALHSSQSHDYESRRSTLSAGGQTAQPGFSSITTSGAVTSSLNDPFGQPRTTYQQGFIMSTSQSSAAPSTSPRFEEQPVVKTKAKINSSLARASTLEFGKDPMFESSARKGLDEDAPPTASVNDIVNGTYGDVRPTRRGGASEYTLFGLPRSALTSSSTNEPIFVVVFGYPPEKYAMAAEYFKQLGDSTEPEPTYDLLNVFRIGYHQPADAMRAVRKNGEIIGGSWMVGVNWADPNLAERVLGQSTGHSALPLGLLPSESVSQRAGDMDSDPSLSGPYARSTSGNAGASSAAVFGTPLRLAPSVSAFRKPGTPIQKPVGPGTDSSASSTTATAPSKGIFGQFSDMVFGW